MCHCAQFQQTMDKPWQRYTEFSLFNMAPLHHLGNIKILRFYRSEGPVVQGVLL